jgi:hypothetical protein
MDVEEGVAGAYNTILADISIIEAGNPMVDADDVKSLFIFHFRPIAAMPDPIQIGEAKVRTNLNEAYYVLLDDQGKYSMLLGDFVDGTVNPVLASQGDGRVNVFDLNVWSPSYFSNVSAVIYPASLGSYKLKYDVGPTSTNYIDGIPEADGKIDFEDLVIFAIAYGWSAHYNPKAVEQAVAVRVEAADVFERDGRLYQPLLLRGDIRDVRALSLTLELPTATHLLDATHGNLLESDGFVKFQRIGNTVTLDMASLGRSMNSEGTLCLLELSGDAGMSIMQALARDGRNRPVDVITAHAALPTQPTLLSNYPNPFAPVTTITFTMPAMTTARVDVFDQLGRRVATLLEGSVDAGLHSVQWNGRDEAGRSMPSGIYFYRLTSENTVQQRSMLLTR